MSRLIYHSCLCAFLLFLAAGLSAQQAASLDLKDVPALSFPAQDNEALLAAEIAARVPGRAPHFAITHETDAGPTTHGYWDELPNGMLSWRLRIQSPNALSLNLGFLEYYMPTGGKLYLYSGGEKSPQIHGPFSPADNEPHQQLWTQIVETDDLVIEVILPAAERENLRLRLNKVNHDFMGFSAAASGSCNLDVVCSAADGWGIVDGYRDIIRSVAVYSTGGGTFCTGFLVNNTNNDCAPLFMTANHCGIGPANAPSLVTYWNFVNSVCREPGSPASGGAGDGQLVDFNTGATHLASNPATDMTIVLLDDEVSPTADAFFAGWSRDLIAPADTMIAVHHPSTDEKRISFSFQDPFRADAFSTTPNPNGTHLTIPDWDIGTTEPGSSGSPVFDRFHRVRGQLHGGGAACGNDLYDTYGYIGMSWEGGGSPTTRLRDHLDPLGTAPQFIDGREQAACQISVSAVESSVESCAGPNAVYELFVGGAFTGPVTMQIEDLPPGWTAIFSDNPASPASNVTLTLTPPAGTSGDFGFSLQATDGSNSSQTQLTWTIVAGTAVAPALVSPPNGDNDASPFTALEWADNGSQIYEYQAATDPEFTAIVASGTTAGTFGFFDSELDANTTYYWRVRAENICGFGDWSLTSSFTTVMLLCASTSSDDVPVEITGEEGTIVFSLMEFLVETDIQYIAIDVALDHTWVGDLSIRLQGPDGTEVLLMDRPGQPASGFGCSGDNLILTFADNAPGTAEELENACGDLPALSGSYQPLEPLSTLYGNYPASEFFLIITDHANGDAGELIGWSMTTCAPVDVPDYSVTWDNSQQPNGLSVCALDGGSLSFILGEDYAGEFDVAVTADGQTLDNYSFDYDFGTRILTLNFTDFIGLVAGDYSLEVTVSQSGEMGSASAPLSIQPAPGLPQLQSPTDNETVAGDIPVTFNWTAVANATSYTLQLSSDENFATIEQEFTVDGTSYEWEPMIISPLYWRVTATNDCGGATTTPFQLSILTSVHDLSGGRSLSIFPNPSRETVFVELEGRWSGELEARLLSINGQVLSAYSFAGAPGRQTIDLSLLPAGTYLLDLRQGNERVVERIVRLP